MEKRRVLPIKVIATIRDSPSRSDRWTAFVESDVFSHFFRFIAWVFIAFFGLQIFLSFFMTRPREMTSSELWAFYGFVVGLPFFVCTLRWHLGMRSNLRKRVSERAAIDREEIRAAESSSEFEAREKTDQAEMLYRNQETKIQVLSGLLKRATDEARKATAFYKERAFTPYWDCVENAVDALREFKEFVVGIEEDARLYADTLQDVEHTFPRFPIESSEIPDATMAIEQLSEVIAPAQRDFQFASIFEQRRTTSALLKGFRNLEDAIDSMKDSLSTSIESARDTLQKEMRTAAKSSTDSMRDLKEELTAGAEKALASAEASEARRARAESARDERDKQHQDFVETALDNLQNKRRPLLREKRDLRE